MKVIQMMKPVMKAGRKVLNKLVPNVVATAVNPDVMLASVAARKPMAVLVFVLFEGCIGTVFE